MAKTEKHKKLDEHTTTEQQQETQDASNQEIKEEQVENTDVEMQFLAQMAENQELSNRLLRLQADFENFKRRTRLEREELLQYANFEILKQLLPLLDNFERAIDAKETQDDKLIQGVTMIYRQFKDILNKAGVKEIECLGKEFDPNLHDAVMNEESEEHDDNVVMLELQKGYEYKEKLLRPAMVKVCKK